MMWAMLVQVLAEVWTMLVHWPLVSVVLLVILVLFPFVIRGEIARS